MRPNTASSLALLVALRRLRKPPPSRIELIVPRSRVLLARVMILAPANGVFRMGDHTFVCYAQPAATTTLMRFSQP